VGAVAEIQWSGAQPDQVIAQDPAPSAGSISVPKISLLASQAPSLQAFVMPNFVGQTLGNVTALLKDAGLRVGTVSELSAPAESASAASQVPAMQPSPASIVVSQTPAPGGKLVAGSAVNFEVR
jgi:beta-lactam-binding protein with PASTA domain